MKKRLKPHDDGFTLVETLVSLTLMALMASYIIGTFTMLNKLNRITDKTRGELEAFAVASYLRQSLGDARNVYERTENNTDRLVFSATPESVSFVSGARPGGERGGLYKERIYRDETGSLVSTRQLFRRQGDQPPEVKTILVRNIEAVHFTYDFTYPLQQKYTTLPQSVTIEIRPPPIRGSESIHSFQVIIRSSM